MVVGGTLIADLKLSVEESAMAFSGDILSDILSAK